MDDLVAWLRERIAARRALAGDAKGRSTGEWTFRDTAGGQHKVVDDLSYTISDTDGGDVNPWRTGPHIAANNPRAVLDLCDAHELVLTEVLSWRHEYIEGDTWFSCSQAVENPYGDEEQRTPGSGCSNDDRAGQPCDCGLDARRLRVLKPIASAYRRDPGYREEWRP